MDTGSAGDGSGLRQDGLARGPSGASGGALSRRDPRAAEDAAKRREGQDRAVRTYLANRTDENLNAVLTQFEPMIRVYARRSGPARPTHVDEEDLVQEGLLGVAKALASFDPAEGEAFSTWAVWRIRGEITSYVRKESPFPRAVWAQVKRIQEASALFFARHGRNPTDAELAAEAGLPVESVAKIQFQRRTYKFLPLEGLGQPGEDHGEGRWMLAAEEGPAALRSESEEAMEVIRRGLAFLAERTRVVMIMAYVQGMSNKDIAAALGVTDSRVSQILREGRDGLGPMLKSKW